MFISEVCILVCSKKCKMTNECKRIIAESSIISSVQLCNGGNIVLPASAHDVAGLRTARSLCLITVLSYQPVEFSRKALSPSLSRDSHTEKRRDLSLYFLCGTYLISNH